MRDFLIILFVFLVFNIVIVRLGRLLLRSNVLKKVFYFLSKKAKQFSIQEHMFFFFIGFIISALTLLVLYLVVPIQFSMPPTTAINWMTENNYPKQKDIYIFAFSFPFIFIMSIILWGLLICRKK